MPGVNLHVASKRLRRIAELFRAGHDATMLHRVAMMVLEDAEKNVAESHDPDDVPYPPLKSGERRRPLVKTGLLLASLSSRDYGLVEVTEQGIRVGTPVAYASYHQTGTRTIPQRRFLGLGKRLRLKVSEMVRDGLADLLRRTLTEES
jgi:phage gpG-like protein